MNLDVQRQLSRNLKGFVVLKMFAKRVFLPLSAIYFVDVSGLDLRDIGLITAWYAIIGFFMEVPTGYFADKFGRTRGIRVGAMSTIIAMLCYIFLQNRTGVFVGTLFEAMGYSFYNGAGEALVHDSLVVAGKEKDYSKVVSRSQSIGLLVNAALLALVPMTYVVDKRLPFVAAIGAYIILFITSLVMRDIREKVSHVRPRRPSFAKVFEKRRLLLFAVLFGFVGSVYISTLDFNNLALQRVGIEPGLIGWIYAISSLIGVVIGIGVHVLKRLPAWIYAGIDCAMVALPLVAAYARSVPFMIGAVLLYMSFFRYRKIIYQDHLLTLYPTKYKATLLSAMNNADNMNLLWVPVALSFVIGRSGIFTGLGLGACVVVVVAPWYMFEVRRHFKTVPPRISGDATIDL